MQISFPFPLDPLNSMAMIGGSAHINNKQTQLVKIDTTSSFLRLPSSYPFVFLF